MEETALDTNSRTGVGAVPPKPIITISSDISVGILLMVFDFCLLVC